MIRVRIVGLAAGGKTPFDGKFLKEYDPGRDGVDPDGSPMLAHIVCTDDPEQALVLEDLAALHELWTRVDPRRPTRPDGKPNMPLTAFTVATEQA
jgi:hypothetical protein